MNLKEIRIKFGLTQRKLADYLNCSTVAYSRYENGSREPSIDVLIKLADLYHVSTDYLIGRNMIGFAILSARELELLEAFRHADPRAEEDALHLLRLHSEDKE